MRILARQHLHHPDDGFSLAHRRRSADAERRSFLHLGKVCNVDRDSPWPMRHHDPRKIRDLGRQGFAANEQLLPLTFDIASARDRVVPFERLEDLPQRQVEGLKLRRVQHDLKLLGLASPNIDFHHAWHSPQPHANLPFKERPEFHRTVALAFQRELIDLPQSCRQGSDDRAAILGRDPFHRAGQPLRDQLSRPVHVRPIVKNRRHHREAVARHGAKLAQGWQSAQRRFDGKGDELFHFNRTERR